MSIVEIEGVVGKVEVDPDGAITELDQLATISPDARVVLAQRFLDGSMDDAQYFKRCLTLVVNQKYPEIRLKGLQAFDVSRWVVNVRGKDRNVWELRRNELYRNLRPLCEPVFFMATDDPINDLRLEATRVCMQVGSLVCRKGIASDQLMGDLCRVVDSESDPRVRAEKLKCLLSFTLDPEGAVRVFKRSKVDRTWRMRINKFIADPTHGEESLWLIHEVMADESDIFMRVRGRKPFTLDGMRGVTRLCEEKHGEVGSRRVRKTAEEFIIDLGVSGDEELRKYVLEKLARSWVRG